MNESNGEIAVHCFSSCHSSINSSRNVLCSGARLTSVHPILRVSCKVLSWKLTSCTSYNCDASLHHSCRVAKNVGLTLVGFICKNLCSISSICELFIIIWLIIWHEKVILVFVAHKLWMFTQFRKQIHQQIHL